ncbi:GntR family transcriptional regulator [uncultured Croceitalea sp.]|uniref:GntR family transcriptional regulator n=1 Tax=uncultured Croceitalea sp. TaxID=1798908 RepID=UPI003305A582
MPNQLILRNKVKQHLLSQITERKLQIGKTLNLAKLSRSLAISVTPIREALSQLEQVRIVRAIPNRGFIIPELSHTEAKHLYDTIAELEVMALEACTFSEQTIKRLNTVQLKLQQVHTPMVRLQHRIAFHHLLVRDCPNTILLALLEDLEARVLFYEQLYITDASFYEQVDNQNEAIIQAIAEDNVPTAALILKMNWMSISEYIQKQLLREKTVYFETIEPPNRR